MGSSHVQWIWRYIHCKKLHNLSLKSRVQHYSMCAKFFIEIMAHLSIRLKAFTVLVWDHGTLQSTMICTENSSRSLFEIVTHYVMWLELFMILLWDHGSLLWCNGKLLMIIRDLAHNIMWLELFTAFVLVMVTGSLPSTPMQTKFTISMMAFSLEHLEFSNVPDSSPHIIPSWFFPCIPISLTPRIMVVCS